DLGTGPHPLQAVHDDPVGRFQYFDLLQYALAVRSRFGHFPVALDLAEAAVQLTDLYGPVLDFVRVIDDEDEALPLVGTDGRVGDQEGRVGGADRHADPAEHAGDEQAAVVGKDRPEPNRAGVRIKLVADEVDDALVRKVLVADHGHLHGDLAFSRRLDLAL